MFHNQLDISLLKLLKDAWFASTIRHHVGRPSYLSSETSLNGPLQANCIKPTKLSLLASDFLIRSDYHFDIMGKGVSFVCAPHRKLFQEEMV